MSQDVPLRSAGHDQTPQDPWALEEQQPTALIALWPGSATPTRMEIIAALRQSLGQLKQIDELENDEVLWNGVYKSPRFVNPLIIWVEPAKPFPPEDEIDDPNVKSCKWIVGVETLLSMEDPFEDYVSLLRGTASGLGSPGILDTVTGRWAFQQELNDLTSMPPAEPPLEILWTVDAISDVENNPSRGELWLHTHGLWRCGRPELEMLEVPAEYMNNAAYLINEIAALTLEIGLPPPGESVMIGPGLEVAFQPWHVVAPEVDSKNSGGMRDRGETHANGSEDSGNPHTSVRAVICAPKPKGVFRKLWVWPQDVVRRMSDKDAVVFRTQRATERRAALAQERWPELATAFASLREITTASVGNTRPITLLKAGMSLNGDEPEYREHLWFEVHRFEGDAARAELINEPLRIHDLRSGAIVDVPRQDVSDWCVVTMHGRFGPSDIPAMWRSIQKLRENHQRR